MDVSELEQKYQLLGLVTRRIKDKPGFKYLPHRHEGVYLFSLAGSASIRLDGGDWRPVRIGQEIHIQDGQLHEAIVGRDGWEYIFAASAAEMKRQGL